MVNNPQTRLGVWQRATFTVPAEISGERVQAVKDRYRLRYGKMLELDGWTVMEMRNPFPIKAQPQDPPDRNRYALWAWVKRRPIPFTIDMPDEWVTEAEKFGFRLKE